MHYSAMVEAHVRERGPEDVLRALRMKLHACFTEASHAVGLAKDLYRERDRLATARSVLHGTDEREHDRDLILREAHLAFSRRAHAFAHVSGRAELVLQWTRCLTEATEKVERDRGDARLYALVAKERSEDDRDWEDAARQIVRDRWTA